MAELPFWKFPTVPPKCEIAQNNQTAEQLTAGYFAKLKYADVRIQKIPTLSKNCKNSKYW